MWRNVTRQQAVVYIVEAHRQEDCQTRPVTAEDVKRFRERLRALDNKKSSEKPDESNV